MQRIPEPELMIEPVQAAAYANADFTEPHNHFVELFKEVYKAEKFDATVLDLGCGPGDISVRFARTFPDCIIHAVDGSTCMLEEGMKKISYEKLQDRIHFFHGVIPEYNLPESVYRIIISNSLLHHLHDPDALWNYIKKYADIESFVFVMDLKRPDNERAVERLVTEYSDNEPDILKRDFYNSLCAAFTPYEVQAQLQKNNLQGLELRETSDRHMIIYGYL